MELLKQKILSARTAKLMPVCTPEWPGADGHVFVRVMCGHRRDFWEGFCTARAELDPVERNKWVRGTFAALCLCDGQGQYIFEPEDAAELGNADYEVLDRIYELAAPLNKLRKVDLETIAKNSESGQSDDSGCDSASPTASPSRSSNSESTRPSSPSC